MPPTHTFIGGCSEKTNDRLLKVARVYGETEMNVAHAVRVFKALTQGAHSRLDLAHLAQCCPKKVGKLLSEMREQNLVYVAAYSNHADGRNRVKIYAIGEGEDAQPRRSQSQEARSRKSYQKRAAAVKQSRIKTTFVGGVGLWQ
jgi:hypothetical protein